MAARCAWIDDERFEAHLQSVMHPESPRRVQAIREAMAESGLESKLAPLGARAATAGELQTVHTKDYLEQVKKVCKKAPASLGVDVDVGTGTWKAATLAAGSVLEAVDQVLGGGSDRVLCNVRPPGHHATENQAMGFCVFNNVALGARRALAAKNVDKVLILDWDVHHGNGTQDIFYRDSAVFYASLHQYPYYPGTGAASEIGVGPGAGLTLNMPLPAGSGNAEYLDLFGRLFLPQARAFDPDLVMISCGFDGHKDDPLGGMRLDEAGFRKMTRLTADLAADCCKGRIVSVLEGGYDALALQSCMVAHVKALLV